MPRDAEAFRAPFELLIEGADAVVSVRRRDGSDRRIRQAGNSFAMNRPDCPSRLRGFA